MNRRLLLVGGVSVLAIAGVTLLVWPKQVPQDHQPTPVPFSKLPVVVYRKGEHVGRQVLVSFYRPLTATPDPLVYHFHPGEPAIVVPATYRLHFDSPPPLTASTVIGTVEGIDPDGIRRLNGVPGLVVLRGCRVLPSSP